MRTPLEPPGTRRSQPSGQEVADAGGRGARDAIVDLPAPTVLYLGVTVLLTTVAGWLGWPVLGHRGGSVALLVVALMLTVAVCRASRPPRSGHETEGSWLLLVPSAGVIVALLAAIVVGGVGQVEWFLNGDHPRHVVYVADAWSQGALTYAEESYPRGWHSLLAALWSAFGAGLEPAAVDRLLRIMASASLLLSAVLALALANVGLALAGRLGLRRPATVVVGLVAACASLLNFSFANFQALGYENSLVGAVVLAACGREVVTRPATFRAVVVCAAGLVVTAHAWQLLLPAVGVAAVYCCWRFLRSGTHRAAVRVAAAALVSGVVALPGLVSVVTSVGLEHATEAGPDNPVPVALLGAGVISAVILSVRARDGRCTVLAAATLVPAGTALLVAVLLEVALTDYYPSKLLWHTAVMGLPWVAAALVLAARGLVQSVPASGSTVRVVGGTAVGLLVLYGLLMPWGAQLGVWSTVDGERVLSAVTSPGSPRAQVVWLQRSPTDDAVARSLLDVYRVAATRERVPQGRVSIDQECSALTRAASPTILSTAQADVARQRYACEPDAVLLQVRPTGSSIP